MATSTVASGSNNGSGSGGGLSALYQLIRNKKDKPTKSSKDSIRFDKERDREKECKDQPSSLWSRANSLRQSLRHRANKHHTHSTSVSVLIDDLPRNRRDPGGLSAPLRREWGSHRDLLRSRKAQSSATLQDTNVCPKSLIRRHSSKSRPGELTLSLGGGGITSSLQALTSVVPLKGLLLPPLFVQDETGTASCETGSVEMDYVVEQRGTTTKCWGRERSRPSWDAPMAVSEPLSIPAPPFGLSSCGVNSRSTPALAVLAARERGKESPYKGFSKPVDKENSIVRVTASSSALIAYETPTTTNNVEPAITSSPTDLVRDSGAGQSVSTSRLLKNSDVNVEKNTALWLSRHKKKEAERDDAANRKSYEDIYEEVASGRKEQVNSNTQIKVTEKHTRSASDPVGSQVEQFTLGGRPTDKDTPVDSLWAAGEAGSHSQSIMTNDNSDSSTYIDSVGSEMKWRDSYSDLSAFSVRSSNQSSGFESGQSTVADAGRLSPQSSLDGSVLMGNYGERVISRFPIPTREGVAHSAKIPSAERHDSESVLYFGQSRANNRGATVSSSASSDFDRQEKYSQGLTSRQVDQRQPAQSKSSLVEESTVCELDDILGVNGKLLDPLKKTKLPETELKQIQKQAVLSYLRQRQATESIGVRPTQFRDKPPDTAEKPTPVKPMAVKLLEVNDIPPELPPKMYKSSELLHGLVQQAKEIHWNAEGPPAVGLRESNDARKPPRPPPKTFKLNNNRQNSAGTMLKTMVTPPPIREKPEKLRQRRGNDSALVMAKMVFIPISAYSSPGRSDSSDVDKPLDNVSHRQQNFNAAPIALTLSKDEHRRTAFSETLHPSLGLPFTLSQQLPYEANSNSQLLKNGNSSAVILNKDASRRSLRTSPTTKSEETSPRQTRFDDGYGTSLDDEDETTPSVDVTPVAAILPVKLQKSTSPHNRASLKSLEADPETVHSAKLFGITRLRLSQEEAAVREEIVANDAFGLELRARLEELGRERELRKLANYIGEVDDIAALVVALALRIARTAATLQALGAEGLADHKAQLVQKLEKAEKELDEARRLESNCEKRWASFGAHLATFLEPKELVGRYLHFMKNRADLLVKQKTIQDRQQMRKP
ncbi:uncharacterized protein LOC111270713 isoform X2 [Varroa jacobsoni]|uniref:uncharacterized protein LOC111270713 isoform X2 n=1 Tax=Varroa jacobsoni TaxID=62625 RepID=UPI000BF9CB98|nr:uncharacterized protein LOC111270713 isoform X2 [Varroa jacobsoni]